VPTIPVEQRLAQRVLRTPRRARRCRRGGAHVSRGGGEARRARRRPQRGERVVRSVALAGPVQRGGQAFGERLAGIWRKARSWNAPWLDGAPDSPLRARGE
jgi:hypothetical protein